MKSLSILAAVAFLALGAASPSLAVDSSISPLCDGAPEHASYARPGGFCSQVASNASLYPTGGGRACPDWAIFDPPTGSCVCAHK